MTNSASSAVASLPLRPLLDLARPSQRRPCSLEAAPPVPEGVWEVLGGVLHQQLRQDALFLWRPERGGAELRLLVATPPLWPSEPCARATAPPLRDLLARRLEAVAHVHCARSDCPLEQLLAQAGLHAGLTTLVGSPREPLLLTAGYRERWQLVAHHTSAMVAFGAYLREVAEVTFPEADATPWWQAPCHVPHVWRQSWRPSVLRTVHDLNEVLFDAVEHCREASAWLPEAYATSLLSRLAHKAGDLMARCESVYWDARPTLSIEELLAEALMLVRGAYQLCRGDWPGCLAAMTQAPQPAGTSPAAIRHVLIDWLLTQLAQEQAAAG